VGNNYKLTFRLLAHLAFDPALEEEIQQEVFPAVNGNTVDETYLLEKCYKLDSLFNEMLRLIVSSSLAHVVTKTTVLNGKTLQVGTKIMIIIAQVHGFRVEVNMHVVADQRTSL
jgi:cytochrome P450